MTVGPSPFTERNQMDDQSVEEVIQTKGLTAPRITLDDIEANIRNEFYFTAQNGVIGANSAKNGPVEPELTLLTFCVLILKNGYTVTGKSACASPENFDAQVGQIIARQNALQEIWPLMGYELKSKLGEVNE